LLFLGDVTFHIFFIDFSKLVEVINQ